MALEKFEFDDAGIQALLKGDAAVAAAVDGAASSIAASYVGRWAPRLRPYVTKDRRNVAVSVEHPAALREQAKHGHLTRAVSTAGFTLN